MRGDPNSRPQLGSPCRVVLCRVVLCRVVSCRVMSSCVVLCRVVLCLVVLCRVMSCCVVSCRVVSCYVVPCCVVLCRVVLCRVGSYILLFQIFFSISYPTAKAKHGYYTILTYFLATASYRLLVPITEISVSESVNL